MNTPMRTVDVAPAPMRKRAPTGLRRFGYALSIAMNGVLMYAVAVWPGWAAVPFLTDDAVLVVPFALASLAVGMAVNATWFAADPPWWRALGEAITGALAVAVGVRLWQVFPFDFGDQQTPWRMLTRFVLAVIIAGAAIGVAVSFGRFVAAVVRSDRARSG